MDLAQNPNGARRVSVLGDNNTNAHCWCGARCTVPIVCSSYVHLNYLSLYKIANDEVYFYMNVLANYFRFPHALLSLSV